MPKNLQTLQALHGERYKWKVMLTVMLGTMTMALSSTIVNVALPDIMDDFAIEHTSVQWLVTAFLSSMAVGMLLNAWAVDRFGARRTYLTTLVLFTGAALVGGFGPSFEVLIGVRVVQGLLAGMVQPLALVLMYAVFPIHQRGQAMGLYAMGVVLGPSFGPVIGGWLVDLFSWRAVFLVVLPFCLAALWLASRYVARPAEPPIKVKFDMLGLLLLAGWLVALLWGLAQGPRLGWQDARVLGALGMAAVLFILFIAGQLSRKSPLLALKVFRYPGFGPAFLVAMLTGAGLFGSVYLLPMLVQTALGQSASVAGTLLLPAGLAMALTFPVVGRMTDRLSPIMLVGLGLAFFAGSCFVLSFAGIGSSLVMVALMAALGRVGLAMTMPPVVVQALSVLPPTLMNQGTGLVSFARQFGGALGVSLSAILLQHHSNLMKALGYPEGATGYQDAFFLLTVLYLLGFIPMARLPRRRSEGTTP